jgi:hypothetical protein
VLRAEAAKQYRSVLRDNFAAAESVKIIRSGIAA